MTSASGTWEPVSGYILFTLHRLVAAGFVLDDERVANQWTRVSPFACLYDIIERIVEISLVAYHRYRHRHGRVSEDSIDIIIRFNPDAVGLRLLATASLLALFTLRHAPWTQFSAALYVLRWVIKGCVVPVRRTDSVEQEEHKKVTRISSVTLALLCHYTLCQTSKHAQPSTLYLPLSYAIVSIMAYFFADGFDQDRDLNFLALLGHTLFICFTGFVWLLQFSSDLPRPENGGAELDGSQETTLFFAPIANFQLGLIGFFLSRQSLERAHDGVKFAAGLLWLAAFVFYYCYWYPMIPSFGLALAERPTLTTLFGGGGFRAGQIEV